MLEIDSIVENVEFQEETAKEERDLSRSPSMKRKLSEENDPKTKETDLSSNNTVTTNASKEISETQSLVGSLTPNPINVPSLIKSEVQTTLMSTNLNASPHSFAAGYSLQARHPIPPPAIVSQPSSSSTSQSDPSKSIDQDSSNLLGKAPTTTNPFPFPFVTPGPGVPFSPQAAAGMTTFYRAPFPPASSTTTTTTENKESKEIVSQNILDQPATSKKKVRKSNARGKGKAKKNEDEEREEEEASSPAPPKKRRKKVSKKESKEETKETEENSTINGSVNQNLLTQIGLINNNPMMAPPTTTPNPALANAQQAQIAAMYNMTPHFGPFNAYPSSFNPAFPPYPANYNFHPAFGTPPTGQPFPFLSPAPTINTFVEKPFRMCRCFQRIFSFFSF